MSCGGTDFNCKEGLCELPSTNQKMLITSKGDNRAAKIKNWIFFISPYEGHQTSEGVSGFVSKVVLTFTSDSTDCCFFIPPYKDKMDKGIRNFRCLFSAGIKSIYFFKALVSEVFLMFLQFKHSCFREMGRASPGQLTQTPAVLKHFEIFISNAKKEWVMTKVARTSRLKPSLTPRNALMCSCKQGQASIQECFQGIWIAFQSKHAAAFTLVLLKFAQCWNSGNCSSQLDMDSQNPGTQRRGNHRHECPMWHKLLLKEDKA